MAAKLLNFINSFHNLCSFGIIVSNIGIGAVLAADHPGACRQRIPRHPDFAGASPVSFPLLVSGNPLSSDLRGFIARYLTSVEQLEILRVLVDSPEKAWTESEVFRTIQSSHESVAGNLRYFADKQFLTFDAAAGYRFSPEDPELRRLAVELVSVYRERPVTVVESIYKPSLAPIRNFAEAFKIKKENP